MATNQLESSVGGLTASSSVHGVGVWAIFALRLMIGAIFIQVGWQKLAAGPFDAQGYLSGVSAASPLSEPFAWIAATPWAVDAVNVLVPWGELLVGIALIAGAFTRLAAFSGAFMMLLFYLGNWTVANGVVLTEELQYLLILLTVAAFGAGRILGLDSVIETYPVGSQSLIERYPQLRTVLG